MPRFPGQGIEAVGQRSRFDVRHPIFSPLELLAASYRGGRHQPRSILRITRPRIVRNIGLTAGIAALLIGAAACGSSSTSSSSETVSAAAAASAPAAASPSAGSASAPAASTNVDIAAHSNGAGTATTIAVPTVAEIRAKVPKEILDSGKLVIGEGAVPAGFPPLSYVGDDRKTLTGSQPDTGG